MSGKELDLALRIRALGADATEEDIAAIVREIRAIGPAGESGGREAAAGLEAATDAADPLADAIGSAKSQLAALVGIAGLEQLAERMGATADAWKTYAAQLKLATDSAEQQARAESELYQVSQDTRTELAGNVALYAKLARSREELNLKQSDLLQLTELTAKGLKLSGAAASEAAAFTTQFGQALGSGVVRGDEFNSMMENGGRLAKALADGLGVPITQLRAMAEAGELTAARVTQALLSQRDQLDREYAELPDTIEGAITRIGNAWERYIGQADQAVGASDAVAEALSAVAEHMEELGALAGGVGVAAVAAGLKTVGTAAVSATRDVLAHVEAQRASALAARQQSEAMAEEALAQAAAAKARQTLALQAKDEAAATLAAATAREAEARATAAAAQEAAISGNQRAAAEREAASATRARMAAEQQAQAATRTAAQATREYTAAQQAAATAGAAATAQSSRFATVMRGALGLLGGWPGLVILATTATLGFASAQRDAAAEADNLVQSLKSLRGQMADLTADELYREIGRVKDAMTDLREESKAGFWSVITGDTEGRVEAQQQLGELQRYLNELEARLRDVKQRGKESGEGIRDGMRIGQGAADEMAESLKRLGLDLSLLETGISSAERQIIQDFGAIATSADLSGKTISAAFEAAVAKSGSLRTLAELERFYSMAVDAETVSTKEAAKGAKLLKTRREELAKATEKITEKEALLTGATRFSVRAAAELDRAYRAHEITLEEYSRGVEHLVNLWIEERDAKRAAADETRKASDSAKEAAESERQAADATGVHVEAMSSAAGVAGMMANWYNAIKESLYGLSEAAGQAFDGLMRGGDAIDPLQQLQRELAETKAEIGDLRHQAILASNGFSTWFLDTARKAAQVKAAYLEQQVAAENLVRRLEEMDNASAHVIRSAEQAIDGYQLLDEQTLSHLRNEVDRLRQASEALADSVSNTLEKLRDERDRARGIQGEIAIAEREYARERVALERQLQEARRTGASEVMRQAQEALDILKGVHEKRMKQLREELAAEQDISRERATRPGTAAPGGYNTGSGPAVRPPAGSTPEGYNTAPLAQYTGPSAMAIGEAVGAHIEAVSIVRDRSLESSLRRMMGEMADRMVQRPLEVRIDGAAVTSVVLDRLEQSRLSATVR